MTAYLIAGLTMLKALLYVLTSHDKSVTFQKNPLTSLGYRGRAQRKPIFQFELEPELFRLSANTPALVELFQLPPRRAAAGALHTSIGEKTGRPTASSTRCCRFSFVGFNAGLRFVSTFPFEIHWNFFAKSCPSAP